tara:strand:- start:1230 stop:3062 length:1833 start_codon:yes stop_codon:yes gene_type:complete
MKRILLLAILNIVTSFNINTPSSYTRNIKLRQTPGGVELGAPYTFSQLVNTIDERKISDILLIDNRNDIVAFDNDKIGHFVKSTSQFTNLIFEKALKYNINFEVMKPEPNAFSSFGGFISNIVFPGFIIYLLVSSLRFIRGGGLPSNINPNENKMEIVKDTGVTFDDVAGCDEVKTEVMEIVDYINNSDKYEALGAKLPKGILLNGPPGTGKTLLARAIAGETGANFISISGSQFSELFVGLGASRVRQLFKTARENMPCIIFIDEIDAIGKKRQSGINFGNDEREQTLNELLTNMDGFEKNDEIVVVGATNIIDSLDDALLRSGRFDRKIYVPLPDKPARKDIANIHFKNKPLANDVNLTTIATITSGFSGADFANLANEAAIQSVRANKTLIDKDSIEEAYEKMVVGLVTKEDKRDSDVLTQVAYHELGHALVVDHFYEFFDLRKISIKGTKSGIGGVTMFTVKEKFNYLPTKKFMLAKMIVAMGGRAGELVMSDEDEKLGIESDYFAKFEDLDISTGAIQDIREVKQLASDFITEYGFIDSIYPISQDKTSETTKEDIDRNVVSLVNFALHTAIEILKNRVDAMEDLSQYLLLEKEIDMTSEKIDLM